MPFTATPSRSAADLNEFFTANLKDPIEGSAILKCRYTVRRSDETFNITDRVIRDLYDADIVICDLSGHDANPNVMYELGVRLASTNKPVVLIRESSSQNRGIFDIQGFYAFDYSPNRYRHLEDHLIDKLRRFEAGEEVYESPVLKILDQAPSLLRRVRVERASGVMLMMADGLAGISAASTTVVSKFLQREAKTAIEAHGEIAAVLVERAEQLKQLDWSAVSLQPRLVPAFQTFLSEPLLAGLLPSEHEKRLEHEFLMYYTKFYAVDAVWDHPSLFDVLKFLVETFRFGSLARTLAGYIKSEDETKRAEVWKIAESHLEATPTKLINAMRLDQAETNDDANEGHS